MNVPHQRKARTGQRHIGRDGYASIYAPENPGSRHDGWIFEHRAVMEQHLGRALRAGENVHHRNGDRADNRPENLELWTRSQPSGQRVIDVLAYAEQILALYGPESSAGLL